MLSALPFTLGLQGGWGLVAGEVTVCERVFCLAKDKGQGSLEQEG